MYICIHIYCIYDLGKDRRGCYFSDDEGDAHLDFYKKYSRQNCLEECFAKAVYEKCKCAKVSSPGEFSLYIFSSFCYGILFPMIRVPGTEIVLFTPSEYLRQGERG